MIIVSLYIWIFKILVSTPHYQGVIMGGRHQNVEDPVTWSRDKRKDKFYPLGFDIRLLEFVCFTTLCHRLLREAFTRKN